MTASIDSIITLRRLRVRFTADSAMTRNPSLCGFLDLLQRYPHLPRIGQ
jgi:hypothetical protein